MKRINELKLYEELKRAYENTTHNFNAFEKKINSVKWDKVFDADGETYYVLGEFILMVENINPFLESWEPSVMFSDSNILYFGAE